MGDKFGRADSWHDRYCSDPDGICDFRKNYDFYFKWLLNKVMQIIVIKGLDDTRINGNYLKSELILDGNICITDYEEDAKHPAGIYAVSGNLGGEPDEYYIPVRYVTANPILGSKQVYRKDWMDNKQNGVVIFNTDIDTLWDGGWNQGLYDLISQTATLLADNIVSINCQQINSRVQTFFTVEEGDGEGKAEAGAETLRKMYSGRPYQVLKEDLFGSIKVNPVSSSSVANNITQLVELQNFIVANFFQSLGIKANNVMKRERLIEAEIDEQNDMVALSLLEMVTSWEKGFREVNEMYGTDIHVELNPVLIREIADQFQTETVEEPVEETTATVEEESQEPEETDETDVTAVEETEEPQHEPEEEGSVTEVIEELEDVVEEVIDTIIDDEGEVEDDVEEPENSELLVPDTGDNT